MPDVTLWADEIKAAPPEVRRDARAACEPLRDVSC